jgi:hypothetical protein
MSDIIQVDVTLTTTAPVVAVDVTIGTGPDEVAAGIAAATEKSTPALSDKLGLVDSEAGGALKWLSFTRLKAWVLSFLGSAATTAATAYATAAQGAKADTALQNAGFVDVTNAPYNAVGNGIADDTAAIQAACDTGRNVFFPAGTYLISAEIVISHSQDRKNEQGYGSQKFHGDGPGATVIRQITAAANGFHVSGMSQSIYLDWRDMTLEGPSAQTSTGCALTSSLNLNMMWRLTNLDIRWWNAGLKGPMVDVLIEDTAFDGNMTGVWLTYSAGIGTNRATIRHCQLGHNAKAGKSPVAATIGIQIDSGYGHLIDGLDCGSAYLPTVIKLTGNTTGQIRGCSGELRPLSGTPFAFLDGSAAGISWWSIMDCMLTAFSAMGATDWPIMKSRYLTLIAENVVAPGTWTNGTIRAEKDTGNLYPVHVLGAAMLIDVYNVSTATIEYSYVSSPFGTRGGGTLEAASVWKGRFLTDFRQGGMDDLVLFATQLAGTDQYAWDNLQQYNTDVRNGRLSQLSYEVVPTAGCTATASATYGGTAAANTIDGDDETLWNLGGSAAGGTSWLKYDFGAGNAPVISKLRYLPYDSVQVMTVVVSGSNDDSTWTEVGRFKTLKAIDGTYLIHPAIGYRYYRLSFLTAETVWLAVYTVSFWRSVLTGPLSSGSVIPWEIQVACSDETTAITTGTGKATFRMPWAATLTAVRAGVSTAPTGAAILIDVNEAGTTVLSTKLMIDATEKTSVSAATPYVISDSALADDAEITIDFDQVGSTIAGTGVKVTLSGTRTIP